MHSDLYIKIAVVCLVGLAGESASGQSFTRVVAFGDSLSDVGNVSGATLGISPGSSYFNGRFSNGPVWVEKLNQKLQLNGLAPSRNGGRDYAYGGVSSGTGNTFIFPFFFFPNAGAQVDSFLSSTTPQPTDLFTLWAGANDFFDGQTNTTTPVNNLVSHLTRLANAGAKNIVVPNLPPLGETPRFRNTPDRATFNARSRQFNQQLGNALANWSASRPTVNLFTPDVGGTFDQILASPVSFGFTNVTQQALGSGTSTPDQYLFFDEVHPTRSGHSLLGDISFELVTTRNYVSGAYNQQTSWSPKLAPDRFAAVRVIDVQTPLVLPQGVQYRTLTVRNAAVELQSGATLFVEQPTMFQQGAILRGQGNFQGNLTSSAGSSVSPGDVLVLTSVQVVGQLRVAGNFTQQAGAQALFDIQSPTVADRMIVTGAALMEGELVVRAANGFTPLPGMSWPLIDFASRLGSPTIVNQTTFAGLGFESMFTSTTLTLRAMGLEGDANLDAIVNFNDLVLLASNYNQSGKIWTDGDFNFDTVVDFNDLVPLARNYSGGNVQADWLRAISIIPEPTLTLTPLALAMIALRRRRRICDIVTTSASASAVLLDRMNASN